jgi:threonine/homoserine/homoserine lactone efflux protein
MNALHDLSPWVGVAGLGIFHGINPAMGWLLAVALGLQEGRRAAVWRALPAIALGHEASVAVAAGLVGGLRLVAAPDVLRVASAALLLAFGAFKLLRPP